MREPNEQPAAAACGLLGSLPGNGARLLDFERSARALLFRPRGPHETFIGTCPHGLKAFPLGNPNRPWRAVAMKERARPTEAKRDE